MGIGLENRARISIKIQRRFWNRQALYKYIERTSKTKFISQSIILDGILEYILVFYCDFSLYFLNDL